MPGHQAHQTRWTAFHGGRPPGSPDRWTAFHDARPPGSPDRWTAFHDRGNKVVLEPAKVSAIKERAGSAQMAAAPEGCFLTIRPLSNRLCSTPCPGTSADSGTA